MTFCLIVFAFLGSLSWTTFSARTKKSEINIHLIWLEACSLNCNQTVIPQATQVSERGRGACSESRLPLDGTVSLYFYSTLTQTAREGIPLSDTLTYILQMWGLFSDTNVRRFHYRRLNIKIIVFLIVFFPPKEQLIRGNRLKTLVLVYRFNKWAMNRGRRNTEGLLPKLSFLGFEAFTTHWSLSPLQDYRYKR